MELDINTQEDFKEELPKDKLHAILSEIVNFGKEIAENGDVS